jgi:hypothetical protein
MNLFAVCALCSTQMLVPALLPVPHADAAPRLSQWQPFIAQAAQRFAIPEDWIRSVMGAESGGRTTLGGRPITSPAGAMGLMQVMPRTYGDLSRRYGLGPDSYEPHDNIFAGAAYLREMYQRYGYPLLFAAYNAGPHRLDDYLLRGIPLPAETTNYVGTILPGASELLFPGTAKATSGTQSAPEIAHRATLKVTSASLFFVASASQDEPPSAAKSSLLFVERSAQIEPPNTASGSPLFVLLSATSTTRNRK